MHLPIFLVFRFSVQLCLILDTGNFTVPTAWKAPWLWLDTVLRAQLIFLGPWLDVSAEEATSGCSKVSFSVDWLSLVAVPPSSPSLPAQ